MPSNIAIIGASGGIGSAFVEMLSKAPQNTLYACSRSTKIKSPPINITPLSIDYDNEESIYEAAKSTVGSGPLDLVIVATGFLHNNHIMPERSLGELSVEKFEQNFLINTIGPALVAKYFLPKMNKKTTCCFCYSFGTCG